MNPSAEWLEQQYSPRLSIPNYQEYFDAWPVDSAKARATLSSHLNLRFGQHPAETLDLFVAEGSKELLVFIHGGYWRAFHKDDFSYIVPPLVNSGYSVALLNYALCPTVSMGEIVEQCRRGIAWLHQNAPKYGVDASRMIVSGHSAGGHLTAMMFATDWAKYGMPHSAIVGGIALSSLFDLEPVSKLAMNKDLALDAAQVTALSPVHLQPTLTVPMLVAVGGKESDEFKRQSALLQSKWPGVASGSLELEGLHHFNILEALMDTRSSLWKAYRALL